MDFYVNKYGAVAERKTEDTKPIQEATDRCHRDGGVRVILADREPYIIEHCKVIKQEMRSVVE